MGHPSIVTAVPEQGDFSELRRGVVRARVSANVVCNPATVVFDAMDGAGDGTGLRGGGARRVPAA